MDNKLGTCRMLGVDFDENKYPPTMACQAILGSHEKLVLCILLMRRLSALAVCRQKVQEARQHGQESLFSH